MREILATDRGQPDRNSGCEQMAVPVLDRSLITRRQTCHSGSFLNLPYKVNFENGNATYEPTSASPADMPGQIVRGMCSVVWHAY